MITEKAKEKARILVFWEKHGLEATLDAFPLIKRSTLYLWKMRILPQKISHFGKIKKTNRQKVLRKPKHFKVLYPGHFVALDTIERFVNGCRRYIIVFEDIYTRFSFAWATASHASLAAKEFFGLCRRVFPFPFEFQSVLTDNGSEFKKHFDEELRRLHVTHYHIYPKMPKMNSHLERFNRTIQDEFVDYHNCELLDPIKFNRKLIDYLIFYNTERVHHAFQNKLSPIQFMMKRQKERLTQNQQINSFVKMPRESKIGWRCTAI